MDDLLSSSEKEDRDYMDIKQLADDLGSYFWIYARDQSKPEPEIRLGEYVSAWRSPEINKRNNDNIQIRNGHERAVRRSQAENIRRINCIRVFQNSVKLLANCLQDGMVGTF